MNPGLISSRALAFLRRQLVNNRLERGDLDSLVGEMFRFRLARALRKRYPELSLDEREALMSKVVGL